MPNIPFSQACDNNKTPILAHLRRLFDQQCRVLEIGSGTGQHAVYFSHALPHLTWQTSDQTHHHTGINAWLDTYPRPNLLKPLTLDVRVNDFPACDAAFTANTVHIMPWIAVEAMFTGVGRMLNTAAKNNGHPGIFVVYGPFKYNGQFTSPSNAHFDTHLKAHQPEQGIRNSEEVIALGKQVGLHLKEDNPMPANNQLLVFTTL